MARQVVLLRGVNVGGRTLSMATLRAALTDAGCRDIATYIQSGNIVLTLPKQPARALAREWLEGIVGSVAGYDVPVVLRTPAEMERTVAENPYPDAVGKALHVVFFGTAPGALPIAAAELGGFAPEHCTLVGRDLYLSLPNGMGRAKLPTVLEQAFRRQRPPVIGTTRNWNTVLKLRELAGG